VTAAIRDISVRKAAEKHLAQMEGRYRGLLEAAPDAMVVVNQAGEIVLLNLQAESSSATPRRAAGQKVTTSFREGFAERLIADDSCARPRTRWRSRSAPASSSRRGARTAANFPIEIMLSPLERRRGSAGDGGDPRHHRAQERPKRILRRSGGIEPLQRGAGQFAYIASHDLQEPLRMVASYTQLLSRRYKGKLDADADEFIAFAVDGASRMQRLIQDLLAYSRVGSKGKELSRPRAKMPLAGAAQILRGAIEDSGAIVTHDPLPMVWPTRHS
jgi:signal transduction histidine kinase